MQGAYYDIELTSNFFGVHFLDIRTPQELIDRYIKADIAKDIKLKQDIIQEFRDKGHLKTFTFIDDYSKTPLDTTEYFEFTDQLILLIGFNSSKFDDLLVDYISIRRGIYIGNKDAWQFTSELYHIAQQIINMPDLNLRYTEDTFKGYITPYKSLDLLSMVFETVQRKSLKQTAISLKWYRVQDLPISPHARVTVGQIPEIMDYCFNDILITRQIHIVKKEEVKLRLGIEEKYGLNVLNRNRSAVADALLQKFYSQYTGLRYYQFKDKRTIRTKIRFGDIINERIHFKTSYMKNVLEEVKRVEYDASADNDNDRDTKKGWSYHVVINNTHYKLAKGGLHSMDRPGIFTPNPNEDIEDADVKKVAS